MLQHGLYELSLPYSYLQYPQGERSPENGISPLGVICAYFRKVYVAAKHPAFALPAADVSPGVCTELVEMGGPGHISQLSLMPCEYLVSPMMQAWATMCTRVGSAGGAQSPVWPHYSTQSPSPWQHSILQITIHQSFLSGEKWSQLE